MEERASVLIAGGGVIGSAIAAALVERGVRDVCVLDLDLAGRYASSELNAGGARATALADADSFARRARRGSRAKLRAVLAKIPDAEPVPGDDL